VLAGLVLGGKRNEHRKRKRPFAVGTAKGVLQVTRYGLHQIT
jgi:hypothetical protein